ncbi:MAG: hypothetical protein IH899_07160 [Planctomycetes bacterium]|nr:hypothetical protein [Planctomycetota bacterium]
MIEINWNPSRKELRVFAVLEVIFFGIVAWLLYDKTGSQTVAFTTFGIAAIVGIVGFCLPKFMRIVYVVWMAAVMPIGWVVSHLVLGFAFFLMITPIGLVMRLFGRDPLQRQFDKQATTYWIPRPPNQDSRRYFRQF